MIRNPILFLSVVITGTILVAPLAQAQLHRDVNNATTTTPDINLFDGSTVNINDLLRMADRLDEDPIDPQEQEEALDEAISNFRSRQETLEIGPNIVKPEDSSATLSATEVELETEAELTEEADLDEDDTDEAVTP